MALDKHGGKELVSEGTVVFSEQYKDETVRFILHILEDEFGFRGFDRPDIYDIPTFYQKDGGNFWLSLQNDKVVGTIGFKNYGNGRGYLKRMYVDKTLRGKGIAQSLLATLLQFAHENGYRQIYLGTSLDLQAAQRFYEKMGFQKIAILPSDIPDCGDTIFYKFEL